MPAVAQECRAEVLRTGAPRHAGEYRDDAAGRRDARVEDSAPDRLSGAGSAGDFHGLVARLRKTAGSAARRLARNRIWRFGVGWSMVCATVVHLDEYRKRRAS